MLSLPFIAIHPDIDESVYDSLDPDSRVLALAKAKALQGKQFVQGSSRQGKCRLLLAADTLVALEKPQGWQTIGKPGSRAHARSMLGQLSGRTHIVFTAICLLDLCSGQAWQALSESRVRFAPMSDDEIEFYLDSDEWQGVAGAYRVQGKGSWFIEAIDGSPSGVMGLPIHDLYGILKQSGYNFD